MNTLEMVLAALSAGSLLVNAALALKLKGKKPPSSEGLGHNR
jgi:hypothetical protein